ncbi:hypothetical protein QYF36_022107 [Acer negundo]|nr:hypothetical protein QYF36_022107 [Acer negundo]
MIISKDVELLLKHHAEYLVDQLSLPQETLKTILDKFAAVQTLQGYMDCANMLVAIDNITQCAHHAEYLVDQLSLPQETLKTILDKFAAVQTLQGYMDCANMLVAIDNITQVTTKLEKQN